MRAGRLKLERPAVSEAVVLDAILRYLAVLERQGQVACVRRINVGPMYTRQGAWIGWSVRDAAGEPYTGHPDVECVLCPSGRMVWVEAKRSGGQASAEQAERIAAARAGGALAIVAASIDEVRDALMSALVEQSR